MQIDFKDRPNGKHACMEKYILRKAAWQTSLTC